MKPFLTNDAEERVLSAELKTCDEYVATKNCVVLQPKWFMQHRRVKDDDSGAVHELSTLRLRNGCSFGINSKKIYEDEEIVPIT